MLGAPLAMRIIVAAAVAVALWLALNWAYQVIRKPTELFFPVSGRCSPRRRPETWRQYGPLFRRHSTSVMTPELLAALAQVEGAGNPVARTYWRWRLTWNPFEWYRPASSAVGMYQITDATFEQAKRYCIHDHVVIEDGPRADGRSCWFNAFYTRVLPSHAVELTAALLDRSVADTMARRRIAAATRSRRSRIWPPSSTCAEPARATPMPGAASGLTAGQQCGDHPAGRYLAQVNAMKRQFARPRPGALLTSGRIPAGARRRRGCPRRSESWRTRGSRPGGISDE